MLWISMSILFFFFFSPFLSFLSFLKVQWAALFALMAGTAMCQLSSASARERATREAAAAALVATEEMYPNGAPEGGKVTATETGADTSGFFALIGFFCVLVACAASAGASVINQFVLQRRHSLNVSNLFMYMWGTGVTTVLHLFATAGRSNDYNHNHANPSSIESQGGGGGGDGGGSSSSSGLSQLNLTAVAYVANMVITGLLVSALLKYAGAITKLFSFALSTVLLVVYTTLLHIQPRPGPEFILGASVVFGSIFSFHRSVLPNKPYSQKASSTLRRV